MHITTTYINVLHDIVYNYNHSFIVDFRRSLLMTRNVVSVCKVADVCNVVDARNAYASTVMMGPTL